MTIQGETTAYYVLRYISPLNLSMRIPVGWGLAWIEQPMLTCAKYFLLHFIHYNLVISCRKFCSKMSHNISCLQSKSTDTLYHLNKKYTNLEGLVTKPTVERFLSCVYERVSFQVVLVVEGQRTFQTLEPLLGMWLRELHLPTR